MEGDISKSGALRRCNEPQRREQVNEGTKMEEIRTVQSRHLSVRPVHKRRLGAGTFTRYYHQVVP